MLAMAPDEQGNLVGHVPTITDAKVAAYKTAAWAQAHGYGPYVMTFDLNSVTLACPGLATMTWKVAE
jgi:hypothetical protein